MVRLVFSVVLIILSACSDSKETRLQRFLIQGNEQARIGNDAQAIGYYQAALELDSCFADAWNNLGTVYHRKQSYENALTSYDHALNCREGYTEALLNRANTLYELKQFYRALKDLEIVSEAAPDTAVLHFTRGVIYTQIREYQKARSSFQKAMEKEPDNPEIFINLGTVCYYQNDFDSARTYLDHALTLDSADANAYNTLALLEVQEGNYGQAMLYVNHALKLKPRDAYFLNNRGFIWLLQGDHEEALSDIDESIIEDPYNAWAYRNKGLYYLKTGDPSNAIRLLSRALDMSDFIEMVHYYLAEAYLANGEKQKACEHFREAFQDKEISQKELIRRCK